MAEDLRSERYQRLRETLKAHRRRAGLTQAALSTRLGKPQSFIAKIETGERRVETFDLVDIYVALGLDTQTLASDLQAVRRP